MSSTPRTDDDDDTTWKKKNRILKSDVSFALIFEFLEWSVRVFFPLCVWFLFVIPCCSSLDQKNQTTTGNFVWNSARVSVCIRPSLISSVLVHLMISLFQPEQNYIYIDCTFDVFPPPQIFRLAHPVIFSKKHYSNNNNVPPDPPANWIAVVCLKRVLLYYLIGVVEFGPIGWIGHCYATRAAYLSNCILVFDCQRPSRQCSSSSSSSSGLYISAAAALDMTMTYYRAHLSALFLFPMPFNRVVDERKWMVRDACQPSLLSDDPHTGSVLVAIATHWVWEEEPSRYSSHLSTHIHRVPCCVYYCYIQSLVMFSLC